ncbi:MAG: carboxypeptidase-like regulatory domain-containing protein [Candidatus Rokuibacteriota bacterium]
MRPILLNRYTIVLGSIAVLVIAWNLYVATHNQGHISGRVVGPDGQGVAGATVTLREKTLTTLEPRAAAQTDGAGAFVFAGQRVHHVVLEAAKDGLGKSERTAYRLAFRGQNLALTDPLRLQP